VTPKATARPEGLSQLKIPQTSSAIKPAIFRFVAQCLNHHSEHCTFLQKKNHKITLTANKNSSGLILCSLAGKDWGFGEMCHFCFTSALKYSSKAAAST